jgi:DNA-binding winged helix-turn-helix (wHTH) protein
MLAWLWTRLSEGGARVSISGRALGRFPASEVERLLRAQVLIEERKVDTWSVCAECDCGLDARPLEQLDDAFRACCPHDPAEDVILQKDDLSRFSVDVDRLVARIAASGNLGGAVACIACGVWLLGETPSGHAVVLSFDAENLVAPGAVMAIRAAVGPKPILAIVHDLSAASAVRLREVGIEPHKIVAVFKPGSDGLDRFFLNPPSSVPRLVLTLSAQSVTLDGRHLNLTPQMFALFRLLIEQSVKRDPVLKKQEIEKQTGRPANEIARDLRNALVSSGLSEAQTKSLVATVRARGYRLGLAPAEVVIEP